MGLPLEDIEQRYQMSRRINAEEDTLTNADQVITSTRNEIEEQYGLYECYTPEKMAVIPPGVDLDQFHPPAAGDDAMVFTDSLAKFLHAPGKPMILALSRPDERKNIVSLLEAYGESPRLQALANLVIVAGNRDDIRELGEGPQTVLTELLLAADCYDLYGKVALPKHHRAKEIAGIYRLAAASKGVFINPALTEPFGLTLLEAAGRHGKRWPGGHHRLLPKRLAGRIVQPGRARLFRRTLPRQWDPGSHRALQLFQSVTRHAMPQRLLLCTDLDRTLLPNGSQPESPGAREHFTRLAARPKVCLAYVSGRHRGLVSDAIRAYRLPWPDWVIGDVGTTIYQIEAGEWQHWPAWEKDIAGDWRGLTADDLQDHRMC